MADFSIYGGKSDEWLALEPHLPPRQDLTLEELKRTTNETREDAAKEEMKILRPKVAIQDFTIPTRDGSTIEARTYRPDSVPASQKLPIYLYFHGGGFLFGTIGGEDATCAHMAIDVGIVVVNVNYRHTPEFVFPTAWHDSEDAFAWVYEHCAEFGGDHLQMVVGGISAGAYLTASLMLKLANDEDDRRKGIQGQILMIPPLVRQEHYEPISRQLKDPELSSFKENEFAPVLSKAMIEFFSGMLFPEPTKAEDRRANPGLATAEEVTKLPPAAFGVCGLDPLRDEGLLYAKLLHDNGIPTNVHIFKGVPHAYRMFGDKLPIASRAWDVVMHDSIRWALNSPLHKSELDIQVHQT